MKKLFSTSIVLGLLFSSIFTVNLSADDSVGDATQNHVAQASEEESSEEEETVVEDESSSDEEITTEL